MSDKDVAAGLPVKSDYPAPHTSASAEPTRTTVDPPSEVDEFGLPVRKLRKPATPQEDIEDVHLEDASVSSGPVERSEPSKEEDGSKQIPPPKTA